MLATVILTFATIGVFALHNSMEDIWTLFFFGLLGFTMRQYGFPLAPMILGVVLGDIAELNLARALAINADPMLFITRPWSLFFAIIAVFSTIFPLFQKAWQWQHAGTALFAAAAGPVGPTFHDGRCLPHQPRRAGDPVGRPHSGQAAQQAVAILLSAVSSPARPVSASREAARP